MNAPGQVQPIPPTVNTASLTRCNLLVPYAFPVGDAAAGNRSLWLIQGGSRFEEMERKLSEEFESAGNRNAPGCLFHAIWNSAKRVNAEFILLDCSPALGRTNQTLVCHCDYFIAPCTVDKLCEKNLVSIPETFQEWYRDFQEDGKRAYAYSGFRQISRGQTRDGPAADAELPLPEIEPKFLGIIMNKYDVAARANLGARDVQGNLVPKHEKFKSGTRERMAVRLLKAAEGVVATMSRSRWHPPLADSQEHYRFSIHPKQFDSNGHPAGSDKCPQPFLLARVRKATPLFDAAVAICGMPMSYLRTAPDKPGRQESDLANVKEFYSCLDDACEDIAHFRRIFEDLASFLQGLPTPAPFHFAYNPATDQVLPGPTAGRW